MSKKFEIQWLSQSRPPYLVYKVISTSSMTTYNKLIGQPLTIRINYKAMKHTKDFFERGSINKTQINSTVD